MRRSESPRLYAMNHCFSPSRPATRLLTAPAVTRKRKRAIVAFDGCELLGAGGQVFR